MTKGPPERALRVRHPVAGLYEQPLVEPQFSHL